MQSRRFSPLPSARRFALAPFAIVLLAVSTAARA
jgi:hypothetical protein